jgi:hypothetical protein
MKRQIGAIRALGFGAMTPRKLLLTTVAAAWFATSTTPAAARPRPDGHLGGRAFEANKTFGLGLEFGAPLGINGKWFFASDRALDFGIGDVYHYANRSGFHIYGDYLLHPTSLASNENFELPFYVGIGARFWNFRDTGAPPPNDAFAIGLRVPLGISFDFNTVPLDLFIQVVPILDFYGGNAVHSIYLDVDASVGVRYWFN